MSASAPVSAPTEARNPRTTGIDRLDALDVLRLINAEDASVPAAVGAALPDLARAVDAAVLALRGGGTVHYVGAGSSGRYAVLDAAELGPTYGVEPGRFRVHLAGGAAALTGTVEEAEDDESAGRQAVESVTRGDVVLGLAASGRTPFVGGALSAARAAGAVTVLVSAHPAAPLAALADVHVCVRTGAEAITGSTRMKAGTAQKLVLHGFSTAVMVRLGHTYSNLMTDIRAENRKLAARKVSLLTQATGLTDEECRAALAACGHELKTALVALLTGLRPQAARTALSAAGGTVRGALEATAGPRCTGGSEVPGPVSPADARTLPGPVPAADARCLPVRTDRPAPPPQAEGSARLQGLQGLR